MITRKLFSYPNNVYAALADINATDGACIAAEYNMCETTSTSTLISIELKQEQEC